MPFSETVVLVEADAQRMRPVRLLRPNIVKVVERLHLDPTHPATITIRVWRNIDGEKDGTGHVRVFREVVPDPPKEEVEQPLYDELVLKDPIHFFNDETPLGWRRKHLRKQ